MPVALSPLRYPGGKQILSRVLSHLIDVNGANGGTYIEPYAGGAGAAISLLFDEQVYRVMINDADPSIYAMWHSILNRTEEFSKLIRDTPTTVEEWTRQRDIYRRPGRSSLLRTGFATFYLNRCNRSGIISNGGPIGGVKQTGQWKIDARYNRAELEKRVQRIALYKDRISLHNLDAVEFLTSHVEILPAKARPFVYLDPPYYQQGQALYLNYYKPEDHRDLAKYVVRAPFSWLMTYDNCAEIRRLYSRLRQVEFTLNYSARERRRGRELMILRPKMMFPTAWAKRIPPRFISSREVSPALPPLRKGLAPRSRKRET